jgi:thiamine biosynthesis lipoprotein
MNKLDNKMGSKNTNVMSRRRAITIMGAAAGLPLAGIVTQSGAAAANLYTWEGSALGAQASMTLAHPSREGAERIIDLAVAEVRRLESIFSLHQEDSELAALNRDGRLSRPSMDMLILMTEAVRFGGISDGAFDVSVQPLWKLYSAHFRGNKGDAKGPAQGKIDDVLKLVDYRRIDVNPLFINLDKKGMEVTLNGIAQGYITDKVSELLRANGVSNVLVSLGETRALDSHPNGRPWLVALKDPSNPNSTDRTIDLTDMSVATSGGYGTEFDTAGRFHHLFNPRMGTSALQHLGVSVITPRATVADALSTAIYVSPTDRADAIARKAGNVTALLTLIDGRERVIRA